MMDKLDSLHEDKHQNFLQGTQNNKSAKSFQYLKNKVRYEPLSIWNPYKTFHLIVCVA